MNTATLAESIIVWSYIALWFVGAGAISAILLQIPFIRNWFEKIGE